MVTPCRPVNLSWSSHAGTIYYIIQAFNISNTI